MNIIINSAHVNISESSREYAMRKLSKLEKFSPAPNKIHLTLSVQRQMHDAEITCHHDGRDLHAKSIATDLHASIDLAVDKMLTLLKKAKIRHAPQLAHANLRAQSKLSTEASMDIDPPSELKNQPPFPETSLP